MPSAAAAICGMIVYGPVPGSAVAVLITTAPSGDIWADADAGTNLASYIMVAMPQPSSLPSAVFIERGCGVRFSPPNRAAPCA